MRAPLTRTADPPPAAETPAVIHLGPPHDHMPRAKHGSDRRQRSAAIRVRVSPADQARLKRDAASAGMSVAGYLASGRLGDETATRPRAIRRRRSVDEVALLTTLAAFNRAHNNLNQIARALNTLALFAEEHGTARVIELLDELRRPIALLEEQFAPPIAAILDAVRHDREG
jgi:Mobilization protein NikA